MFDFIQRLLDLFTEWYKARQERRKKAWLEFEVDYGKKRHAMDDSELNRSIDDLLRKEKAGNGS